MANYLILVRHGESRWNLDNKFTGWVDVPLSEAGIQEALASAKNLEGLRIEVAFTSKLVRAQQTLLLILARQNATGIFVHKSKKRRAWALHPHHLESHEIPIYSSDKINERYYGKLQGMNKDVARQRWGKQQVFLWRRSYTVRPPGGECLKDVVRRAAPYFEKTIMPYIKKGKNVIVAAHGNSLRAMIKHIENMSDKEIPHLELPLGTPLIYRWTGTSLVKEAYRHSFDRPLHWHQVSPKKRKSVPRKKSVSAKSNPRVRQGRKKKQR